MKKIDSFINRYPISKTLRFSLIPVGKTEENFDNAIFLENDKQRANEYKKAKKIIDRYHKHFIEKVLSTIILNDLNDYAELYFKSGKCETDLDAMESLEDKMRKAIAKAFSSDKTFSLLFKKELIQDILPKFLTDADELETINMFQNFTTYFSGFHENRKNIYVADAQSTAIGYRCINENLPKFLDNIASFEKFPDDIKGKIDEVCIEIANIPASVLFDIKHFNAVLAQSYIEEYNSIIGGYTAKSGEKIQGINECINLYNQQVAKGDKFKRLPLLKVLYKQILSDREAVSFLPESFEDDNAVIDSIRQYFESGLANKLNDLNAISDNLDKYDTNGIFVKSGVAITDISNSVFGDWSAISRTWNKEYEELHPLKNANNSEKYYDEQAKAYKKISSFSIAKLQQYGDFTKSEGSIGNIITYYQNEIKSKSEALLSNYENAKTFLSEDYSKNNSKKLCKNEDAIKLIKVLLDSVKDLERLLKPLLGTGKEENKSELFYGDFLPVYDYFSSIDKLYDKVRNYVTKKPYSNDKIKLNFENSHFMSGWTQDFETKGALLLKRKSNYYIGIINKRFSKNDITELYSDSTTSDWEHIDYDFQKPDNKNTPRLFIRSKGTSFAPAVSQYDLPIKDIIDIYDNEYFKTSFRSVDPQKYSQSLKKLIDYFKLGFSRHESYNHYSFCWKDSADYKDISEFYADTIASCYMLHFKNINETFLTNLVESGQLYLFQIYNKDFSEYSHGNPNLHTMYFKMLFDEKNLRNVVYQLNGGAEMFYRDVSIKDGEKIVHPANQPIKNKNPDNPKKESIFDYDITKDKRYTKRQFSLHIPITLNFKADGQTYLNNEVRKAIKDSEENYVIGIDRGERNLLYISVINSKGEIIEQKSLNKIVDTDYHKLLDSKEKDRDDARKNWGVIENIKELKEGYLSQVVHEICKLVLKYDAIIAMEDLNFGFKRGRFNVEKQVYQKFENMLITKLNYLVDKTREVEENGGLLRAYQLTNKVEGVNKAKQNGFIFYVPAWLTSKIDPVTGFVNLLNTKYTNVRDSLNFIEKIDDIRYNASEDLFKFDVDFAKFPRANLSYVTKWTICTNGERILTFRNSEKNQSWDNKTVILTEEFKTLFDKFRIDYKNCSIKEELLKQGTKDFHKKFLNLLSLTLQMRNSETGNVDIDYLISPVKDKNGNFYDSRNADKTLPENADANGAYNIARKALWAISVLKDTPDDILPKADLSIKQADWLRFAQQ